MDKVVPWIIPVGIIVIWQFIVTAGIASKISAMNSEAIKEEQDISNQFYAYKWIKTKVVIKNHIANLK
ncbi:hypothetical protein R5R61_01175 [Oenococcus oeni]